MTIQRLKLYYGVGTLETPLVVEGTNATILTKVITNGPTVTGNPDRYGNLLEPNNTLPSANRVDWAVTGTFVPAQLTPPSAPVTVEDSAFFYNIAVSATVAIEGLFPFDTGAGTAAFLHTPSPTPATSAPITIVNAGTYEVEFTATTAEAKQIGLFLDGVLVPGSIYGQATGTSVTTGIVQFTATAGQVMTLRNHSSAAALTLVTPSGGTQANSTNSLFIKRLGGTDSTQAAQGVFTVTFQNAVTHVAVDDPSTVQEVEVVVKVRGMNGGSLAGTLYIQKQHSIES